MNSSKLKALLQMLGHRVAVRTMAKKGGIVLHIECKPGSDWVKVCSLLEYHFDDFSNEGPGEFRVDPDQFKLEGWKTGICRDCGCSNSYACLSERGPCYWVDKDLCSACEPGIDVEKKRGLVNA